jgi:hypothetical protein
MTLLRMAPMALLVLVVCLGGLSHSRAADRVAEAGSQETVLRSRTDLVTVDVSVEDSKTGEPIKGLQREDFVVQDDKKTVSLTSFSRGADHVLRRLQLWFVLTCNEYLYYVPERGRVNPVAMKLGSRFLDGKRPDLAVALGRLEAGESVGVAHWCDNGESEIDLQPTVNREAVLDSMQKIAGAAEVTVHTESKGSVKVLQLINDVARTTFPEPYPTVIFAGSKRSASHRDGDDGSSGVVNFSSLEFGLGEGPQTSAGSDSKYAVAHNQYGERLSAIIEILHNRHELGFAPRKEGKAQHHISVTLAKNAERRYPHAVLRYPETYSEETPAESKHAKHSLEMSDLDSKMRAALASAKNMDEMAMMVSQVPQGGQGDLVFNVRIGPGQVTRQGLPDGKRQSVVTAVVASYSAKGKLVGLEIKNLEIKQDISARPDLNDKPVTFSLKAPVAKGAARIRVVVRDVASGRRASQDLPQATN